MEKPFISTDVGDVPLYVIDGENGFVVNTGYFLEMGSKLSLYVLYMELRQAHGAYSLKIAKQERSVRICIYMHLDP